MCQKVRKFSENDGDTSKKDKKNKKKKKTEKTIEVSMKGLKQSWDNLNIETDDRNTF